MHMTDSPSVSETERVTVCAVEDLPPGGTKTVTVGRREVVCMNVDGTYRAIAASCPHRGANLAAGTVCGTMLPSDPHQYHYGREGQLLRCPWHGWVFDLGSGRLITDEKIRVSTYPVEVVDGEVQVLTRG